LVNTTVLEYLRTNRKKYLLEDLNKEILSKGYKQEDIDSALKILKAEEPQRFEPGTISKLPSHNYVKDEKKSSHFIFHVLLIFLLIIFGAAAVVLIMNFFDFSVFGFNLFNYL
jgi:hypothetical protein